MDAERSKKGFPAVPINIEINPSLVDRLDINSLKGEVAHNIEEIIGILGIPAFPLIHINPLNESQENGNRILSMSVNGQKCAFATSLLRHIYDLISGEDQDMTTLKDIWDLALKLPSQKASELVQLCCIEMVKHSPAFLLTMDAAAAYWAFFSNLQDVLMPDLAELHSILKTVLNLRISISNQEEVVQVFENNKLLGYTTVAMTEEIIKALRPKAIEIQMPYDYLKQITLDSPESEQGNFAMMRDGLFDELGIRFPDIRFVPVDDLGPERIRFTINHLTTLPHRGLPSNEFLVNDTPDRLKLLQIQGRAMLNPANQSPCGAIRASDVELAEDAGLTSWNQMGYLILAMSNELRTHAAYFLDQDEVEIMLDKLDQAFPRLIENLREQLSSEMMTQVLRNLLSEELSIRNLRKIIQAMIDLDNENDLLSQSYTELNNNGFSSDNSQNLTEYIRKSMNRYISNKYARDGKTLVVYLLDHEIEALLTNNQVSPQEHERILASVHKEIYGTQNAANIPIVLTSFPLRPMFHKLIKDEFPRMAVISYEELSENLNIQPMGRISLS